MGPVLVSSAGLLLDCWLLMFERSWQVGHAGAGSLELLERYICELSLYIQLLPGYRFRFRFRTLVVLWRGGFALLLLLLLGLNTCGFPCLLWFRAAKFNGQHSNAVIEGFRYLEPKRQLDKWAGILDLDCRQNFQLEHAQWSRKKAKIIHSGTLAQQIRETSMRSLLTHWQWEFQLLYF
jgi:hypothetical protein